MNRTTLALCAALLAVALCPAPVRTQGAGHDVAPDLAVRVLRAMEARGAGIPGGPAVRGSGNPLFRYTGSDNAACVRALSDVTGDGRDEVIVGYDIFQSGDNFYCLDGASSGLATVFWSLETQGGASGGYFYGDDCLSIASDVNGDGLRDILAGLAGGGRFAAAYCGRTGQLIWQYDTYANPPSGWVYSIHEVGDVNDDGVPDVFFGTGSDHDAVHMIDGTSTGTTPTVLWSFPGPDVFYSVAGIGDASGDSVPDVIAGVGDLFARVYAFDGTDGSVLWTYDTPGTVWDVSSMDDLNGDGVREALSASWSLTEPQVHCLDGASGNLLFSANVGDYAMRVVPIEDADGDGKPDVLVASWDNALHCRSSDQGTEIWQAPAGTTRGGDVWTTATLDDVNGDCHEDAVFGSFDGKVYGVDGKSGAELWSFETGNRVFSVTEVGDLNGDGAFEVAAGTQDTQNTDVVHAIEGDSSLSGPATLQLLGEPHQGSAVTLDFQAPASSLALLCLALGDGCIPFLPFGLLQLDPGTFQVISLLPVPASGQVLLQGTLPTNPGSLGAQPHIQCAVLLATNPTVGTVTNRVRFTIFP